MKGFASWRHGAIAFALTLAAACTTEARPDRTDGEVVLAATPSYAPPSEQSDQQLNESRATAIVQESLGDLRRSIDERRAAVEHRRGRPPRADSPRNEGQPKAGGHELSAATFSHHVTSVDATAKVGAGVPQRTAKPIKYALWA